MKAHRAKTAATRLLAVAVMLTLLSTGLLLAEGADSYALARNLKKWQSLSPEKQRELRERLARFKSLPEEERLKLQKRMETLRQLSQEDVKELRESREKLARMDAQTRTELREKHDKWGKLRGRLLQELPDKEREKIESLSPRQRDEELRRLFAKHRKARTEKFFHKLPDDEKRRLEELTEQERAKRLQTMMKEQARKRQREEMERFYSALPEEERKRLDSMPEKERRRALLEMMGQRRSKPPVPPRLLGLLTPEQRMMIESLAPERRLEAAQRMAQEMEKRLKPMREKLSGMLNRLPPPRRREVLEALRQLALGGPLTPPGHLPPGLNESDVKFLRALPLEQLDRLLQSITRGQKKPQTEKSQ